MYQQHRVYHFTPVAQQVMNQAQHEARLLQHAYVGTEHLLLALLHEQASPLVKTLQARGTNADRVQQSIAQLLARRQKHSFSKLLQRMFSRSQPVRSVDESLPLTGRAVRSLALAVQEMRQRGDHTLDVSDLLLGLAGEGEGIAAQALQSLAISSEALRAQR